MKKWGKYKEHKYQKCSRHAGGKKKSEQRSIQRELKLSLNIGGHVMSKPYIFFENMQL